METPSIEIYRLNVEDASFSRIAYIKNEYIDLTYTNIKNAVGACQFSLDIFSPYARKEYLRPWQCNVAVRYGNKIDWFGPITQVSGGFDGVKGKVTVQCYGYGSHLNARTVTDLTQFDDETFGDIVWSLINTVQSRTNGELLIKDGTDTTTTTHDKTYEEGADIGEKIYGVTNLDGGPAQILFTPVADSDGFISKVNVDRYQTRGRTRNDLPTLQLQPHPGGNVEAVSFNNKEDLYNYIVGLGAGTGEDRLSDSASDSTSQKTYTRREQYLTFQDVSVASTLEDKVDNELTEKKNLNFKYNIELAPENNPGLGSFIIGDDLNYDLSLENSNEDQSYLTQTNSGSAEVVAIGVDIDNEGVPHIVPTLEF